MDQETLLSEMRVTVEWLNKVSEYFEMNPVTLRECFLVFSKMNS